jgi:hypothetical protein
MNQALKDFNQNSGFSQNNNPIENSFQYLSQNVVEQLTSFVDSVKEDFKNNNDEKTTI